MDATGKVVKTFTHDKEKVYIEFEDGSQIYVELDSVNNSCHCHPEYEYFLDTTFYPA